MRCTYLVPKMDERLARLMDNKNFALWRFKEAPLKGPQIFRISWCENALHVVYRLRLKLTFGDGDRLGEFDGALTFNAAPNSFYILCHSQSQQQIGAYTFARQLSISYRTWNLYLRRYSSVEVNHIYTKNVLSIAWNNPQTDSGVRMKSIRGISFSIHIHRHNTEQLQDR